MSSLWPRLNVTFFHFSIGRVTCLLSWTLYICLVLICYHIWLSALPPRHQLSLITDIRSQTYWAHNYTTFSQHLNKHIEKRKVTDHCTLVNHIFPLFFIFCLGILEVLHCVLVESPEALNIIKEGHIKSIISLLDKHGRNHKVSEPFYCLKWILE